MYSDDTVIYVHGKTNEHKVAQKLGVAMSTISDWFTQCCLTCLENSLYVF